MVGLSMAPPDPVVPLRVILEALARRVRETSLRSVAGEVELSPNGLRGILAGAPPRPSNLKKLVAWFSRLDEQATRLTPEVAEAALAVLTSELPPGQRADAQADLRSRLQFHFDQAQRARPRWLAVPHPRDT